ncbi:MAG: hypothetical protein Q8L48_43200 [Archangium sp.]|nr:hypothetical protein [Archangium sp.]
MGPAGGTVSSEGVTLVVPPGALSVSTRLTVTRVSATPPAGTSAVGNAFQLGPEGLQFEKPIALELPLTVEPPNVLIATSPAGRLQFELLPAEHSALRARVQVSHFSIFIPVTPDERDGGADAGTDAGVDGGAVAGVDGGVDAGAADLLEACQSNWNAIGWWALGDAGSVVVSPGAIQVIELPGAWVFTVGAVVYSVDRATLRVLEVRDTSLDTLNVMGFSAVRTPSELVFTSARGGGQFPVGYAEWRVDLNGRFKRSADGGVVRELDLPGTWASPGGFNGLGSGATFISSWEALVVASDWTAPAIGVVPLDPALPPWTVPVPVGFKDSTNAIELADQTVLIGLNSQNPPFPQNPVLSRRTDTYVLGLDGGLTATGWGVDETSPPWGLALASGGDAGAVMVTYGRTSISIWERARPAAAWVGELLDAGSTWPLRNAVKTTPGGRIVVAVPLSGLPLRYGANPLPADVYLVTYPPGRISRLITGLRSSAPPSIGAVREDSFIFAFYDERTGLHAARLCLPP